MSKPIQVITSVERRRKWSESDKENIVKETYEAGASVSSIARKYKIPTSQLFLWRKLISVGRPSTTSVSDMETNYELERMKETIKKLEWVIGRKTVELEIAKGMFNA